MQNLSNSTAGLRDLILVCTSCVCFSKPVLPKNYSKHFQPKRLQNDAMWVQPMWKRKDQCFKSFKKTTSIYDSTSDSCVRFSWHFEPYWKAGSRFKYSQVGEPELCRFFESGSEQMKVHIPVLWRGFLPFYAWQSQVPRLSPFAFVNSLNLIHHEVCWQNWAIESIEKTQMDPNSISYNQKGPNQDCVFAMRALPEDQAARECD